MSASSRKRIKTKSEALTPGELLVRAGKWADGLQDEADRGCALATAEMLNEVLESLIANRFVNSPTVCKRVLSESMAPLGTFAARINIALLMGLIAKEVHDVLHRIRAIRNAFAHEPMRLNFADEQIADVCHGLPDGFDSGPMPRRGTTKKALKARKKFMSAANFCMSAIITERLNVQRLSVSTAATCFSDTIDPALHIPDKLHKPQRARRKKKPQAVKKSTKRRTN